VTWLAKQINSRGLSLCAVPLLTERETIDLRSCGGTEAGTELQSNGICSGRTE
jgi:hypothetical protein